ncbi:hypothetical protein CBR_g69523, partial [Chara braunii]
MGSSAEGGEIVPVSKGKLEAKASPESLGTIGDVDMPVVSAAETLEPFTTDETRAGGRRGLDGDGTKVGGGKPLGRRGLVLKAALAGGRAIGRAWDFLVDEKGFEESQSRVSSEQMVECGSNEDAELNKKASLPGKGNWQEKSAYGLAGSGERGGEEEEKQEVVRGLEMFINAKLKSGMLKCRCDPSMAEVKRQLAKEQECRGAGTTKDGSDGRKTAAQNNSPVTSPRSMNDSQKPDAASHRSGERSGQSYQDMAMSRDGFFLPTPAFFSRLSPSDVSAGRARLASVQPPPFAVVELASAEMSSRFWEEDPRYISVLVGRCAVFQSRNASSESRTLDDVVIGLYPAEKPGDDGDGSAEELNRGTEKVPFADVPSSGIPVPDAGLNGKLPEDYGSYRSSGRQWRLAQGRHAFKVIWWKESDDEEQLHSTAEPEWPPSLGVKEAKEEKWSLKIAVGKVIVAYWPGFIPMLLRFAYPNSEDEVGKGWWDHLQSLMRRLGGKGGGKRFKKGGVLKAPAVFKLSSFRLWTESVQLIVHSSGVGHSASRPVGEGYGGVQTLDPMMETTGAAIVARTGFIKYWLVDEKGDERNISPQVEQQDVATTVYAVQLVIDDAQIGLAEQWKGMK